MRRDLRSAIVGGVVALVAAGCGFTFERPSELIYRRIIAMQSEPAEIVGGGPLPASVRVRALVVDPLTGVTEVPTASWTWRRCVPSLGKDFGLVDDAGRCALDDENSVLKRETGPLDQISVDVPVPLEAGFVLQQLANASPPQGISVYLQPQVEIARDGDTPIVGVHLVPMTPNVPAGRAPNRNPRLIGLLFDGEPWPPDVPVKIEGAFEADDGQPGRTCGKGRERQVVLNGDPPSLVTRCAHRITPVFDANEAEHYDAVEFDGDIRPLQERLRFSWFTDAGSFNYQNTEQPQTIANFETDPISTDWAEPAEDPALGTIGTVWVVVRDGRGGVSWEKRLVQFD